jgi:hypothetical protein
MAFDIYGIEPRKSHSVCLRFNIWKWNDFRHLLKMYKLFDHIDERGFMSNDGYRVTDNKFELFKLAVHEINSKIKFSADSGICYFESFYSELDSDLIQYHGEIGSSAGQNFSYADMKLISLFVVDCDGFVIR